MMKWKKPDFVNNLINLLSGGAASDEDVEKLLGMA